MRDSLVRMPVANPVKSAAPAIRRETDRIDWVTSIPFLTMHVAAIAGLFYFSVTWQGIALCVGMYYLRMFGITAGYHRYFSHRSYKTGRGFQFVLALLGGLSVQKGALWWAANHRHHHRYSDMPEDVHSPVLRGFWWSHVGWVISRTYDQTDLNQIRDFAKYPELLWLNKHFLFPVVTLSFVLLGLGGMPAVYWGFVASTVLLWHGTFTVNSLAHVWGTRRFDTTDDSRNNFWIAMLTMGEGWHNNHHHYLSSARQGFIWWEIDASYYTLKALEKLGLVWDLRAPPNVSAVEAKEPVEVATNDSLTAAV
ncbi:MAG: acyl-CoA desaturase [Deltaproteobacteria bacterium]|nr:acyl-CoA desaturase [Deltaproteobacteria bacterium]